MCNLWCSLSESHCQPGMHLTLVTQHFPPLLVRARLEKRELWKVLMFKTRPFQLSSLQQMLSLMMFSVSGSMFMFSERPGGITNLRPGSSSDLCGISDLCDPTIFYTAEPSLIQWYSQTETEFMCILSSSGSAQRSSTPPLPAIRWYLREICQRPEVVGESFVPFLQPSLTPVHVRGVFKLCSLFMADW